MSLLLIAPDRDMQPWKEALLEVDSNLDIEIWPEVAEKKRVQFAVTWHHPHHVFEQFPNLKTVSSLGAGADHILNDETLPKNITICRIMSKKLVDQMKGYILNAVLNYQHNMYTYFNLQKKGIWKPLPNKDPSSFTIGLMGLGKIGKPVARQFVELGYNTVGWAKSEKQIDDLKTFTDELELKEFLNKTTVLICMLPLTSQTKGILNLDIFKQLKQPGYLINVGRGEQLVEEDLIYAIDKGWLEGATLDVFTNEPLPQHHLFWNRDSIIITPHISSISIPADIAPQIIENYKRTLSDMPLNNKVDRDREY